MAISAILQFKKDSYLTISSQKFKIKRSKDRKRSKKSENTAVHLLYNLIMEVTCSGSIVRENISHIIIVFMFGLQAQFLFWFHN